ncbi:MAG: hypothetical protein EPN20_20330 [Magnetospirillum sp.]|nr:MAG: hypothetical protein EPN20_20330 [Magnetospirillum sp.]
MAADYQIYRVPLSEAGSDVIRIKANYFKLLWAGTIDADKRPAVTSLSAMVECSVGQVEDDYLPLGINSLVAGEAHAYWLRWKSQPGVWAFFLISLIDPRSASIQIDAPPTSQIVTQAMGATVAMSSVSISTAALLAASSATRQKLTIKNTSAAATLYLGASAAVTSATGFPLAPGEGFTVEGSQAAVYAVASAGSIDVRLLAEG